VPTETNSTTSNERGTHWLGNPRALHLADGRPQQKVQQHCDHDRQKKHPAEMQGVERCQNEEPDQGERGPCQ